MPCRPVARAGALAALLLSMAACGGSDPMVRPPDTNTPAEPSPPASAVTTTTAATARTIEVAFAGGQVVGGPGRHTARLGERVRLRVTSDVADEVHVHTYDQRVEVVPDRVAELEFTASVPGRHEVELEKLHKQLLTLEVR
jgi:predicted small lipoprotein YifL